MRQLNTYQIGTAANLKGELPNIKDDVPDHIQARRLVYRHSIPVKNPGGGPVVLAGAELLELARSIFGHFFLAFGDKVRDEVEAGSTFDDIRARHVDSTGLDVTINNIELRAYPLVPGPTDPKVEIAPGITSRVVLDIPYDFVYERLGAKLDEWCPGPAQLRQLHTYTNRGTGFPAGVTQDGSVDVIVLLDDEPGQRNDWVRIPRFHHNNDAGLTHKGPPIPGALLNVWLRNTDGELAALSMISLERQADTSLHTAMLYADIRALLALRRTPGEFTVDDANGWKSIYAPERMVELAQLLTFGGITLRQHAQNLSPMRTTWFWAPAITKDYEVGIIAPNVGLAQLVSRPMLDGRTDTPGHALSVSAVSILRATDAEFKRIPGDVVEAGGVVRTFVPEEIKAEVRSTATAPAVLAKSVRRLADYSPGGRSALRGAQTETMRDVVADVAPSAAVRAAALPMLGR